MRIRNDTCKVLLTVPGRCGPSGNDYYSKQEGPKWCNESTKNLCSGDTGRKEHAFLRGLGGCIHLGRACREKDHAVQRSRVKGFPHQGAAQCGPLLLGARVLTMCSCLVPLELSSLFLVLFHPRLLPRQGFLSDSDLFYFTLSGNLLPFLPKCPFCDA